MRRARPGTCRWLMGVLLLCAPGFLLVAAPMPFDVFAHLSVGMRETDMLRLAGAPDFIRAAVAMSDASALPGVARDKQYVWQANKVVPYATLVSVRVGVVVAIERDPDF